MKTQTTQGSALKFKGMYQKPSKRQSRDVFIPLPFRLFAYFTHRRVFTWVASSESDRLESKQEPRRAFYEQQPNNKGQKPGQVARAWKCRLRMILPSSSHESFTEILGTKHHSQPLIGTSIDAVHHLILAKPSTVICRMTTIQHDTRGSEQSLILEGRKHA